MPTGIGSAAVLTATSNGSACSLHTNALLSPLVTQNSLVGALLLTANWVGLGLGALVWRTAKMSTFDRQIAALLMKGA
jgi:hypothetical protein